VFLLRSINSTLSASLENQASFSGSGEHIHQHRLLQSVEFLVSVRVFHCPHTTALSQALLSYVIPSYGVVSCVVVRHTWLVLDYTAAISYRLGFIALSRVGGVYWAESHHALWADDGNRFFLMSDEVTEVLYKCSAICPPLPFWLSKQGSKQKNITTC